MMEVDVDKKHWVEKLFSPHFNTDDFFNKTFEPELLTSEKAAREKAKSVEGIYQAAILKSQAEEKLKRKAFLSKMIVRDYDSPKKSTEQEPSIVDQSGTCSCGRRLKGQPPAAERCIWTGNELNILRCEINKNQSERAQLKRQVKAYELEISELRAKYEETERALEATKNQLAIAKKESACKKVHLNQTQKELLKKDAGFQQLREELHEKCAKLRAADEQFIKAREEIQGLQLKNKDLENALKRLKQQQEIKNATCVEKVEVRYNVQINKLRREVEAVKGELNNEKIQHARDVTALEILRKHFSSLSTESSTNFVQLNVLPH